MKDNNGIGFEDSLVNWVMTKCEDWRDHYETNYEEKFEEYYRLWRGIWAQEDTMRQSERSRIITPALQQAVESSVAEVEEATFGRGKWFDIRDDRNDTQRDDIEYLKNQLTEDMEYVTARKAIAECVLNAAVYGTGIGELVMEEVKELAPATQPMMDGQLTAVGVTEKPRLVVKLQPIQPQNFLIDPVAASIDEALGVAVDRFVPLHTVQMGIDTGIYEDVPLETAAPDDDLEADRELSSHGEDKVRLTKYYGLVPSALLDKEVFDDEDMEVEEGSPTYVEAMVVIANGAYILKAEPNPYMMQDRPIVAFPWDTVPNRFWGRGVCEKGYNAQKALDTELRARIDALALTVHPMMAVDASRLPRGAKMEIRPGKTLLTNGNPSEILQPFNFGKLDQVSFAQGKELQQMVQQATGALDTSGIPSFAGSEATASGISMSLGAIIKRHKRTLINFQDSFLIPFVKKSAYRYMQFSPELYPVQDFKFVASSSLGIIAREYEVTQLVQLLQTMSADSPMYPMLIESIVDNMNLSNREEIIKGLKQANQPNPEQQQAQQMAMQMQIAKEEATLQNIEAQTAEIMSRIQQNAVETQLLPVAEETKRISALSNVVDKKAPEDKQFEKLTKFAELRLKERELETKEDMVEMQMRGRNGN